MRNTHSEQIVEPLAYQVNPFCRALGISRSSFYEMLKRRELNTIIVAGRRLVPKAEVDRLLSSASAGNFVK